MRRLFVLLAMLIVATQAHAAVTLLQAKTCAANGSSEACAFTSNVTAGSFIAICSAHRDSSRNISTVVDEDGDTYNLVDGKDSNGNASNYLYYAKNATAGAKTITVTYSASVQHAVTIAEFAGVSTTSPLDTNAHQTANASGASQNTGTLTGANLDQANNLFIGCFAQTEVTSNTVNWSGATSLSGTGVSEAAEGGSGAIVSSTIQYEIRNGSSADEQINVTGNANAGSTGVGRIQAFKEAVATFTLTITPAGAGKGRVASTPAGVNCGPGSCSGVYDTGTVVTLLGTPAYDSNGPAWSGDADCSDGSVTMSADVNCTATFAQKARRDLTITKILSGGCDGLIRSAGREIDCGTGCASDGYEFIDGEIDWVNAYPDAGCKFDGWGGAGAPATTVGGKVTMSADRTLTATFSAQGGAAEHFHVRPGGSNATNCTGLANADYDGSGTGEACAFNTVAEGVNGSRGGNPYSCANGDDVSVHGVVTYSENVAMPSVCQCPSRDNPCVIQFDGATTIMDPGANTGALTFGNTTAANRARFIEVRNGRLKGGTATNIGADGSKVSSEVAVIDTTLTDFAQFGPKTSPPDSAVMFAASNSSTDGNIIDGVVVDGDETSCVDFQASNGAHTCGTRYANAFYGGGSQGLDIRNVVVKEIRGCVGRLAAGSVVQDSRFIDVGCMEEAADDACFQVYDAENLIFRRLDLEDVRGGADSGSFPIIKMRRTCIGSAPCANPVNPVGMAVYNVTTTTTACSGTTSACAANSRGSAVRADGVVSFKDGPGAGDLGVYGEFTSSRIIYQGVAGTGSLVLYTDDDTDVNSVCPSPLTWTGDIFYQSNTTPANHKTCSGTFQGYDSTNVQTDPGIDGNRKPTQWAEACFPFGNAYTARDGDVASGYVGAYPGACASAPASESCFDGILNQNETCNDGGGVCGATCDIGEACGGAGDCVSGLCSGGICSAPSAPAAVVIGRNPSATKGWPWWNSRSTRRVRP